MLSKDKLVFFKLRNGEGVTLSFTLKNECPIFNQDVPRDTLWMLNCCCERIGNQIFLTGVAASLVGR